MRIPTLRLLFFTGPGVPVAAMGLPMVIFLPPFYAGTLGLDLAAVGFVFFLVRALDVPFDPLVGYWADRTRTRWGRFKPWIAAGGAAAFVATFFVFFAERGVTIVYLFGWLLLLYAGQSMLNVAHMSWAATLSEDYHERSRVFSFWQGGHVFGLIFVLLLPAILDALMGDAAPRAVSAMGLFILISIPISVIVALLFVPRTRAKLVHDPIRLGDVRRMFFNSSMRTLLAADVLASLTGGALGTLFRFFFEESRGFDDATASVLLLIYFVSGLLALPLWLRLARRFGKARAAAAACFYGLTMHVVTFFIFDADKLALTMGAIAFAGLNYAAVPFLLRAMLADHAEDEKKETGADRVGILNAVLTTAQKIGYALPVGILFPLLAVVGFHADPAIPNSDRAMFWLEAMYFAAVPLLLGPTGFLLLRFKADRQRHESLKRAASQ